MAGSEPWFAKYETEGRSGQVATQRRTGGLSIDWWAKHAIQHQARIDAGEQCEYDCD